MKKSRILFISLSLIVLLVSTKSIVSDPKEAKKDSQDRFDEISRILNSLGFVNEKEVNIDRVKYPILESVSPYKIVSSRRLENMKTGVDLVFYKYDSQDEAKEAYLAAKNFEFIDDILKDYNFLFLSKESIVLLKSGCNQSKETWKMVVDGVKETSMVIEESMDCYCGGLCQKKLKPYQLSDHSKFNFLLLNINLSGLNNSLFNSFQVMGDWR